MSDFFELFLHGETYVSLITLTCMEIVLGIDNIIFISIISGKLPPEKQAKARTIGLALAVIFRIGLLFCIAWIAGLVNPLFSLLGFAVSGRDLILIGGGLFLLSKSTLEIHSKLEAESHGQGGVPGISFLRVVSQIVLLDVVFSFDSVITAVGLVQHISIMVVAIVFSLIVMLVFAGGISNFVNRHPTIKMLALAFLLMIGTLLIAEGCHFHVPRGYAYFAMAFSVFVEFLNMKARGKSGPNS